MKDLIEYAELAKLEKLNVESVKFQSLGAVTQNGKEYPIPSLTIGSEDKTNRRLAFSEAFTDLRESAHRSSSLTSILFCIS